MSGDLAPGEYFLALGLYEPEAEAVVPLRGSDGVWSEGLWRVPQPIIVTG
ncbi:MAG: hypothetical protein HC822_20000 [Oscillochloris sp.]|nr:hypothetical protein [Oscillochloris sp.]